MDDADLLYEDLFENLQDGRAIIKTSVHEMEDRITDLSNEAEQLTLQVRNLQAQNEELSKQNEVLIRNISCLFKTAQMEISRKDKQIRSLQQESPNVGVSDRRSLMPVASLSPSTQRQDTASLALQGNRGESVVMVPKTKSKSKECESVNGAWEQACQAGAGHQDRVEMLRVNGKGGDSQTEMQKRQKCDEDCREGYDWRRGNERYLGARTGEAGARHEDCMELRDNGKGSNSQSEMQKRRKCNEDCSEGYDRRRGNQKYLGAKTEEAGARQQDCVELLRDNGKGSSSQTETQKRRKRDEDCREGYNRRRGNERFVGATTEEGARRSSFNVHRDRRVCS